ncbi:(Fe-S)-binding protein [Azoarcus indigens]|uniref:(Fe-S)-binding protein n=1 Tax=Azoarcus indigens TaxID=29545 RepID=UPI001FE2BC69|nr:(Fe-S)-binding protein [Azoarcus indigens]
MSGSLRTQLDWSAYEGGGFGDSFGDPFGGFGMPAATASPGADNGYLRAAALCQGKGQCQRKDGAGVMCPSFRATDDPLHSTRGRAAALRELLEMESGAGEGIDFASPRVAEAMALCLGCKGCKRECPNGVDMALLRTEFLAQRAARLGVPRRDRLFAGIARQARGRALLRAIVALRNRLPLLAGWTERLFGIARDRSLPLPAARPFTPAASAAASDGREVLLLVDSFNRGFEPEVAQAALEVLQAAGYAVRVLAPAADDAEPRRSLCCGRSLLSYGLVEEARAEARRMMAALAPAIATGTPVIGLEPSCLYMLKDEYFSLGLGEAVGRLTPQVFLLEEFLASEQAAGRLKLALKPLPGPAALVHGHCHQKAQGGMEAVQAVLGLIPGFEFRLAEAGCCGMAGSFGLEAEHAALSRRIGEAALLPAVRAVAPGAPVLADGFSCRHQIRDGAGRRAEHVALLLRRALA